MALQLKGGSYGLRQVSSSNKTALLMKLTDSALRIIESYQDHPGGARAQPTIQFQGNQGVIRIPVPGGEPELQEFTFHVSNLPQSAGVDCLQQIRSGHTGRVECLGSIQQKVTVNATDDSYNMTRQRMTLAKEEEQKISTKVIKQPGSKIGKVFKKKTGKGRIVEKHHNSVGRLSPDTRAPTPPMSRLTPTQVLNNRSSSPLTIPHKDNAASPPGVPGSGRNKTKPMMSISSTSLSSIPPSASAASATSNAAVAARPLWDRVAHLLAVRPYKYPEIVLRLTRDKAPDKSRLQTILQKVASTRNTAGGEYCLLRSIYNSIEVEWPGYTDAERQAVKKKLAEFNGSSDSRKRSHGSTLSPPESVPDGQEDQYSNPATKKQRVSHYKKPSPGQPGSASGASPPAEAERAKPVSPPSAGISFGTAKLPHGKDSRTATKQKDHSANSHSRSLDKSSNHSSAKHTNELKHSPIKPFKSEKHKSHQSNNVLEHTTNDDDFLTKYTQISSVEQRDRYKQDFYAEYQEYLSHHSNVAAVSGKFAELQRKLNEHKKGSVEYDAISRQVIQEYKKTKKNNAYHQERERMQFLHRKLQHIKGLVNDFDRHRLASRSENEPGLCMQTKTATRVA